VQNDINGNNEKKNIYKPGQYFVLRFDFSRTGVPLDLEKANQGLIMSLNSSIKAFYHTYAAYLGRDAADLCREIKSESPNVSLRNCSRLVEKALREQKNEELAGVKGIYLLVDEYDAFPNNYLDSSSTIESRKTAWEGSGVERTFRSFWSMAKSLGYETIKRAFITGVSPLSLSSFGGGFNVTRNLSFDEDVAGLCGLKYSDLKRALEEIDKHDKHDKHLSVMTKFFSGYHFSKYKTVETVYNTETCLAYLQSVVERKPPQIPQNSEVSEIFLRRFVTSAPVIADLGKAVEYDEKGNFTPLAYYELEQEVTFADLVC
jgi:Predicted AAA-ATPase